MGDVGDHVGEGRGQAEVILGDGADEAGLGVVRHLVGQLGVQLGVERVPAFTQGEDVLYEHDSVREAAVVGVPDEYRGESVKAFVSLRPGTTATADELIEHCRARMAAYKYPREVAILDEVPKTATGKMLRRELR